MRKRLFKYDSFLLECGKNDKMDNKEKCPKCGKGKKCKCEEGVKESVNWKDMTKKERIKFLVGLGMDKKEALEIYTDDPKELPKEVKTYLKD